MPPLATPLDLLAPAVLSQAPGSSLLPLLDPQIYFHKTPPAHPENVTLVLGLPWPPLSPSGPARPTSSSPATTALLPTSSLAACTTTSARTAMASRHGSGAAAVASDSEAGVTPTPSQLAGVGTGGPRCTSYC
ncbi:hypothetical protein BRADI_1g67491v3 [Brachypodium distachyon]|uniref:Uncharacterized protein n=1 Tax=Brachypodium distachyon TaxID=15368 RepID=A0A2K2DTV8_BRADI|nr:hypothetical protein BRADI_1g67491v3 [Brachypodium distachyon]